jgi:hypothetical protein
MRVWDFDLHLCDLATYVVWAFMHNRPQAISLCHHSGNLIFDLRTLGFLEIYGLKYMGGTFSE